ncbi:MAG: peptidoglycan DD-metalloendopeptidase family protein [Gammaproteobacteria bacterium]|nr:peptidoglycan DD-metalloendopeptidase family protein [Gammaproteobacteria bacterium]MBU1480463.1 peptidoglycan DD-metalloendopeptidase family protein [Gammaproteobacteria bacterium]
MEYGADRSAPTVRGPAMGYSLDTASASSVQTPAEKKPVMDSEYETVTRTYTVQKGDTLYSIAFLNGVDYRDVADWNNLENPAEIKIGQQLRLNIPVAGTPPSADVPRPVMLSQVPEPGVTKSYPKVGKLAYTDHALAQAERLQNDPAGTTARPAAIAPVKSSASSRAVDDERPLEWGMPTNGKLVAGFSESDNRKGVDIAGQRGQAVVASASGKVVYSGSGLRGYGKLIIIKHNKTYLSAYAHNDRILVKEGQSVSKGQKIAEMGNTDASQVGLHFEIRKLGKPVDPAQYLPLVKS